jgi:hypothetical protein
MCKLIVKLISLILIVFCSGCSTPTKSERAKERGKQLQEFVKTGDYIRIYADSADCIKSNYSPEQFVAAMNEAVEKLKSIDEKLEFWDFELNEDSFNDKWVTYKNYGVGFNWLNKEINKANTRKHATVLTGWQDENGELKLTAFQVLINEGEKQNWYGTSSCKTTDREVFVEAGQTKTKTTMVTDPL